MNRYLQSARDFSGLPDQIEAELKPSSPATCSASSRWGTMLAVGCESGDIVLYDALTRSEITTLPGASVHGDTGCATALAWSRWGDTLAAGYAKGFIARWDIRKCALAAHVCCKAEITSLGLARGCILAGLVGKPPLLWRHGSDPEQLVGLDGSPVSCALHKGGGWAVLALESGYVIVVCTGSLKVLDAVLVPLPRHLRLSPDSRRVLFVAGGSIHTLSLNAPPEAGQWAGVTFQEAIAKLGKERHLRTLRSLVAEGHASPLPPLIAPSPSTEFRDAIDSFKWLAADASRDGAFVAAGVSSPDRLIVHVWDAATTHGAVVLEGPRVGLRSCHWHPDPGRKTLVTITGKGSVFVWAYLLSQNWDAYAPGFRTLAANEVYVESETEFDLNEDGVEANTGGGGEVDDAAMDTEDEIDVEAVPRAERFLIESDTEEDVRNAVLLPVERYVSGCT